VDRPHHQLITAGGFQRIEIRQHARQGASIARHEAAGPHVGSGNLGERPRRRTIGSAPEGRMRNVITMVRIQRDGDGRKPGAALFDQAGEPQHVLVGARNRQSRRGRWWQIAEIVLRIDDKQVIVAFHFAMIANDKKGSTAGGPVRPSPLRGDRMAEPVSTLGSGAQVDTSPAM